MNETGGSLNPNDLATLSLLNGYGRFGGGVGVGHGYPGYGGGYLPMEALANGTATKEAIDGNREFTRIGLDRIADTVSVSSRSREFDRLNDQVSDISRDISNNNLSSSERANHALLAAQQCCCETQKAIAEAAKEAAKCCCESKLQACKDHAELKALIIEENSKTRELIRGDALAAANAKITQLETINALSGHHHGRP